MPDPITTLIQLNAVTLQLDEAQSTINRVRAILPMDQRFQLELDRKQAEVDEKRDMIALIKLDISSRN